MVFENKISWNTVITVTLFLFGGVGVYNAMQTQNAVQDVRIEANRLALKESIETERQARKEALQDLRIRIDADRVEMRQQFDKLNTKVDELLKQRTQ